MGRMIRQHLVNTREVRLISLKGVDLEVKVHKDRERREFLRDVLEDHQVINPTSLSLSEVDLVVTPAKANLVTSQRDLSPNVHVQAAIQARVNHATRSEMSRNGPAQEAIQARASHVTNRATSPEINHVTSLSEMHLSDHALAATQAKVDLNEADRETPPRRANVLTRSEVILNHPKTGRQAETRVDPRRDAIPSHPEARKIVVTRSDAIPSHLEARRTVATRRDETPNHQGRAAETHANIVEIPSVESQTPLIVEIHERNRAKTLE